MYKWTSLARIENKELDSVPHAVWRFTGNYAASIHLPYLRNSFVPNTFPSPNVPRVTRRILKASPS